MDNSREAVPRGFVPSITLEGACLSAHYCEVSHSASLYEYKRSKESPHTVKMKPRQVYSEHEPLEGRTSEHYKGLKDATMLTGRDM